MSSHPTVKYVCDVCSANVVLSTEGHPEGPPPYPEGWSPFEVERFEAKGDACDNCADGILYTLRARGFRAWTETPAMPDLQPEPEPLDQDTSKE